MAATAETVVHTTEGKFHERRDSSACSLTLQCLEQCLAHNTCTTNIYLVHVLKGQVKESEKVKERSKKQEESPEGMCPRS